MWATFHDSTPCRKRCCDCPTGPPQVATCAKPQPYTKSCWPLTPCLRKRTQPQERSKPRQQACTSQPPCQLKEPGHAVGRGAEKADGQKYSPAGQQRRKASPQQQPRTPTKPPTAMKLRPRNVPAARVYHTQGIPTPGEYNGSPRSERAHCTETRPHASTGSWQTPVEQYCTTRICRGQQPCCRRLLAQHARP